MWATDEQMTLTKNLEVMPQEANVPEEGEAEGLGDEWVL